MPSSASSNHPSPFAHGDALDDLLGPLDEREIGELDLDQLFSVGCILARLDVQLRRADVDDRDAAVVVFVDEVELPLVRLNVDLLADQRFEVIRIQLACLKREVVGEPLAADGLAEIPDRVDGQSSHHRYTLN